ncbi:unnamed protein product [Microthlaspi erraticum]|uniref:Uncharacterized protein n=1 Tax=Microthlaspi erraticum TaxID=1685480 RepID=A0A6D2LC89_9BRAS|nr:unnamed protein product [Microthlaspi erraticum]
MLYESVDIPDLDIDEMGIVFTQSNHAAAPFMALRIVQYLLSMSNNQRVQMIEIVTTLLVRHTESVRRRNRVAVRKTQNQTAALVE